MILQDSQLIESDAEAVVSFLENMDRHYLDWHPDHISFAWLDGEERRHFHFEEMIGRWRLRMAMKRHPLRRRTQRCHAPGFALSCGSSCRGCRSQ